MGPILPDNSSLTLPFVTYDDSRILMDTHDQPTKRRSSTTHVIVVRDQKIHHLRSTSKLNDIVRKLYPYLIGLGLLYILGVVFYGTMSPFITETDSSPTHVQKPRLVHVPDPHFWVTKDANKSASGPFNWTGSILM